MSDSRFRSGVPMSPLLLSHQLLELAEIADRAGLRSSASNLVELAQSACTERPRKRVRPAAIATQAVLPANVTRLVTAAA